jgi:hypothetical protein
LKDFLDSSINQRKAITPRRKNACECLSIKNDQPETNSQAYLPSTNWVMVLLIFRSDLDAAEWQSWHTGPATSSREMEDERPRHKPQTQNSTESTQRQ